ncbi:MAG: hypothetical protein KHW89_09815 [Roseburia sp.]|nr:hypothetical protein [Roseburia sp.]
MRSMLIPASAVVLVLVHVLLELFQRSNLLHMNYRTVLDGFTVDSLFLFKAMRNVKLLHSFRQGLFD